jgi:hypothetical protein
MRNKQEIINQIGDDTATTLVITFLEKSGQAIRAAAHEQGRTYKTLETAVGNGMGRQHWLPGVKTALAESLHAACATDTSACENKLREEAFKQSLKTYVATA